MTTRQKDDLRVEEPPPTGGSQHLAPERFKLEDFASGVCCLDHDEGTEWLADQWLPVRSIALFGGPSQIGKTLLSVHLSVCVASGLPFLGRHEVRQGTVAYVTAEDEKRLLYRRIIAAYRGVVDLSPEEIAAAEMAAQRRRSCAEAEISADKGGFLAFTLPPLDLPIKTYVGNAFRFGDEKAEAAFVAEMLRVEPSLVVLDPLKDLVPAKGGLDGYFNALIPRLPMLRQLRDTLGCSFLIVTHTKKLNAENTHLWDDDSAVWGSALVTASFDMRWIAKEVPQPCEGHQAMLIRRKPKTAARPPLFYFEHWTDEAQATFECDGDEKTAAEAEKLGARKLDEKDLRIIAVVKAGSPRSRRELHKASETAGVELKWSAFKARLDRLLQDGHLRAGERDRIVAAEGT